MAEHSPTPWRIADGMSETIVDAQNRVQASAANAETAVLIVAAVNATGAWREERRRLQLAAASAEAAFANADARRTLLERYYCEVYADRDRLRDLVRKLVGWLDFVTLALFADSGERRRAECDKSRELIREADDATVEAEK